MKLLLAVLLGLAAYCAADSTCGPLEKVKIRRQWDEAFGEDHHRIQFATHLFQRIFKDHPEAREQFSKFRGDNIYHPVFQAMGQRVLAAISLLIETTDEPEILKELLVQVKTYLGTTGVKPEFYTIFRNEMLETLPEYLDTHLDWDAWTACLDDLINVLKA